jgi:hypothetical protein
VKKDDGQFILYDIKTKYFLGLDLRGKFAWAKSSNLQPLQTARNDKLLIDFIHHKKWWRIPNQDYLDYVDLRNKVGPENIYNPKN